MLIVALVLAVIGLAALVTAVVTSNEVVAWVCIAASVLGVVLLIVDAIRERQRVGAGEEVAADDVEVAVPADSIDETYQNFDAEYPESDVVEPATVRATDPTAEAGEVAAHADETTELRDGADTVDDDTRRGPG
jgi:hypothetical protein